MRKKTIYRSAFFIIIAYLVTNIWSASAITPSPSISIISITGSLGHTGTASDPFVCATPSHNPDELITFKWRYTTGLAYKYEIKYKVLAHLTTSAGHDDSVRKHASDIATKDGNNKYTIEVFLYTQETPFTSWKLVASDSKDFWITREDASINIILTDKSYVQFPVYKDLKGTFKFYVGHSDYIRVYLDDRPDPYAILFPGRDYTPLSQNSISIRYNMFQKKTVTTKYGQRYTYFLHKIKLENYYKGVKSDVDIRSFYMAYNYAKFKLILVAFNPGKWDIYTSPWASCKFIFHIQDNDVGSQRCTKNKLNTLDPNKFYYIEDEYKYRDALASVDIYSKYLWQTESYFSFNVWSRYGKMHEDFTDPDTGIYELFNPSSNKDGVLSTETPSCNTIYDFGFRQILYQHYSGTYVYFNLQIYDLRVNI